MKPLDVVPRAALRAARPGCRATARHPRHHTKESPMYTRMTLLAASLALAAMPALASDDADHAKSCFADFKPMTGDVGEATLPESAPYRVASPKLSQLTIVARDPSQAKRFDSGNYDMHTANENGPDAGR
jgi:uncharacterized protein